MEKRKWPWKRKPCDKSPGEIESSESISSLSERYSDDQDGIKTLQNGNSESPEVTSKTTASSDGMDDAIKVLAEKLSASLVNVSAKEDLVKQHSKVAEEAVAGWEKAENEVALLKQQLEAVTQKNSTLEDRENHLDGALKECVRQLRQGKEEQEQKVHEAILAKSREWESTINDLEAQIGLLKSENSALKENTAYFDPNLSPKLEFLERENKSLRHKLLSLYEELEIVIIERDLSVQAAENASKQYLEGIKKVAKLEAECRKLQVLNHKSFLSHDQKSVSTSSNYEESLTDTHSDCGVRSTLISELDQIKSEKSPLEIDMMNDFLEIERLVALPKIKDKEPSLDVNSGENKLKPDFETMSQKVVELEEKLKTVEAEKNELEKALASNQNSYEENQLKDDFEAMSYRVLEAEKIELEEAMVSSQSAYMESQFQLKSSEMQLEALQKKLEMLEAEKAELEKAVASSQSAYEQSQFQLKSYEMKLETLQKELDEVNESREIIEFRLHEIEAEAQTMSSKVDLLKEEIAKERSFSNEKFVKCRELEDKLARKSQEIELQSAAMVNGSPKEQAELNVASGKLSDCQKTIASLGRQLQSLATLEDFLIDTANLPGFSENSDFWKSHSNGKLISKNISNPRKISVDEKSPHSSSSSTSSKSRNGFGKLFTRTKSSI